MREIVSPLSGIRSPFGPVTSLLAMYAVLGFKPQLAFDFDDERYFTGSRKSTFSDAITHSASSNATMVDSDGLLKWRPHNLLTYSEDFTNWASGSNTTVTADATTAPDVNQTADRVQLPADLNTYVNSTVNTSAGAEYTFSVYVKAVSGTSDFEILDNLTGTGISVAHTATTEWQIFTVTRTASSSSATIAINNGNDTYASDIYIWGAHVYRSDLGGMVNNPDRGDSYVPTTSSAVYLPRRGHHVYNGSAWVNEGVLHESEARTNLVTYSNLSTGWTIGATDSFTKTQAQAIGRDGELSLAKIAITDTTSEAHQIYTSATVTAGATYSLSVDAKFGTHRYWALRYWTATGAWAVVVFDLQTGVVTQTSVGGSSGTIVSSGIENYNGIFRVHLSAFTASGTTGYITIDACSTGTPTLAANDGTEVFAGTAGAHSFFGAAQLEAGSTPSSCIPTNSGATVTRAAETLTIPAANLPWPTPVVIGEELVTNGTFDTDTDWTKGTGWTISGGVATHSGGTFGLLTQSMATSIGSVYLITADLTYISGGAIQFFENSTGGEIWSSSTSIQKVFVATANNSPIGFGAGSGDWSIDNISVKEINPLSVSIQMQGQMTYADTGQFYTVRQLSWEADADNKIILGVDTSVSAIGQQTFVQEDSNVADIIESSEDYYSPGINVPFNIASRHGSTFVNGAVDGTEIGVDITPTALPDLSATDLSLGETYMGTIKLFRIWANDLADAGIAEATLPSLEPSLSLTFDGSEGSFTVSDWSE